MNDDGKTRIARVRISSLRRKGVASDGHQRFGITHRGRARAACAFQSVLDQRPRFRRELEGHSQRVPAQPLGESHRSQTRSLAAILSLPIAAADTATANTIHATANVPAPADAETAIAANADAPTDATATATDAETAIAANANAPTDARATASLRAPRSRFGHPPLEGAHAERAGELEPIGFALRLGDARDFARAGVRQLSTDECCLDAGQAPQGPTDAHPFARVSHSEPKEAASGMKFVRVMPERGVIALP
jgi:hypothetical protein